MFGRYNQNGTSSYVEDPLKDKTCCHNGFTPLVMVLFLKISKFSAFSIPTGFCFELDGGGLRPLGKLDNTGLFVL